MPNSAISERIRFALFNELINEPNVFLNQEPRDIIDFADRIWNLRSLPSTDSRYENAYDDAVQHMIRNSDWTWKEFFLDRLGLASDGNKFNEFLEAIVNPENRENEDDITKFVFIINQYLESSNLELTIAGYQDNTDLPIYRITDSNPEGTSTDIRTNRIPIFIVKDVLRYSNRAASHNAPTALPALVLVFNHGWNDYSYLTTFHAFLYTEPGNVVNLGEVKLIPDNPDLIRQMEPSILQLLDEHYAESIPDTFCSLGQSRNYYLKLKEHLDIRTLESLLFALKDVAFFSEIREKFATNRLFSGSLLRYPENEQIMRQARPEVYGFDLKNLYKFTYVFTPPYAEDSVDIKFEFANDTPIPNRIYALIGKNGTGKTQLITKLPIDIAKRQNENFIPKTPLFSKVIAVSYSVFDKFKTPRKTSSFNYIYCGLKNTSGQLMSEVALTRRFNRTQKTIKTLGRIDQWRSILVQFIDEETLNQLFIRRDSHALSDESSPEASHPSNNFEVLDSKLAEFRGKLSSGQNIMFYVVSEIVANIMYDSLLLFDEPETHLHPNAITELMNTVYELVNKFQSYCIIATHSPLVIRELFSKNVFVIRRSSQVPSIEKLPVETFGENLTTLTEEVFGNKDIPKQYKTIIEKFVAQGLTFEEIISLLQSDSVTPSLNARIYIKSLINERI